MVSKSIVRKIALGVVGAIALVVAVFCLVVAMQPADYRVVRSVEMAAAAAVVFEQVNDFHSWEAWSPWAKLDPEAKNSFAGPTAGAGSSFRWSGNDKVGEGQMTILESKPAERVKMQLEFIRPFPDSCITEFGLAPAGDKTSVTWTMAGPHQNFLSKAFCLVMNMDKMVGGGFEKGLANIKAIVEARPPETVRPGN
jgi:hypothetical protein